MPTRRPLVCQTLSLALVILLCAVSVGSAGEAVVQRGVSYGSSGQKLDACTPKGPARTVSIVFIHGGGFSQGSRADMRGYCRLFAQGGFRSSTISYRLTSQGHAFPAALTDVKEAVHWMRKEAQGPTKVVLVGYSAGATLALSAGLADRSGIAGIIEVAGISDFETARAQTPHRRLRKDLDAYIGEASLKAVSPVYHVSRGDPPVFIFHGKQDNLVPVSQAVILAKALERNGVKHLLRVFDDGGHGIMLPGKHLKQLLHEMTGFLAAIDAG